MAGRRNTPHTFGRVFTQALRDKNITRYRLRQLTGKNDSQLYGIAKGCNAPTVDTIIWIAEAIGMEPHELFRRLYEAIREERSR